MDWLIHTVGQTDLSTTVWIVPELDDYLMVANSAENEVWQTFNELVDG